MGGPLGIVEAAINVYDTKLLTETLDTVLVERPAPTQAEPQHLCLDIWSSPLLMDLDLA